MTSLTQTLLTDDAKARRQRIVDTLSDAFAPLIAADPAAFRTKFRKMAANPFAFYRGSACLFYADVAAVNDPWADERASRVWIQGDLHAENFGTYLEAAWSRVITDERITYLGRATARVHCVSDADSDHTLVPFQAEDAIATAIGDREIEFIDWLADFALDYGTVVRDDHRLFVGAFRNNEIAGVRSTQRS